MFPTNKMKTATSNLCADILKFLTRAHKWYCEGRLKRAFHSFTQPFDLRYADILQDIRRDSSVVRELAACGQMVELRHVNNKIDQTVEILTDHFSRIHTKFDNFDARLIESETRMIRRLDEISTTTHCESLPRP